MPDWLFTIPRALSSPVRWAGRRLRRHALDRQAASSSLLGGNIIGVIYRPDGEHWTFQHCGVEPFPAARFPLLVANMGNWDLMP